MTLCYWPVLQGMTDTLKMDDVVGGVGSEMWKNQKVMRISRQLSALQIAIGHKQLANAEHFNCLRSFVTNDTRCTRTVNP